MPSAKPISKPPNDIHERIYELVLAVIEHTSTYPGNVTNDIIQRQLIRSASSIGANSLEAESASTKKEFIRGFTVAKREAKESWYWLRLLGDVNTVSIGDIDIDTLIDETDQIVRILSTIILNSKKSL